MVNFIVFVFMIRMNLIIYNYFVVDLLLIKGEDYLIWVKVVDLLGVNYFDNEGWSVIEFFYFGGECFLFVVVSFGEISDIYFEVLWQFEELEGVNYIEVSIEDENEEIIN